MGRVVVVGSVNADLVVQVQARPRPGETVRGGPLAVGPGGKGANQAVAAAVVGAEVTLVGAVGDDTHADVALRGLRRAGVDLTEVDVAPGATGTAVVVVTPDGENSIVVSPGANGTVQPGRAAAAVDRAPAGAVVVLQLELPAATVEAAVRQAAARGLRVVVNAAPAAALSPAVLAACDPLVVNGSEAAVLLGQDAVGDPAAAARALLALGPRSVVVTLGAEGAVHASQGSEKVRTVTPPRVAVVDTTGAGDAFVGALCAALADGLDLGDAVGLATLVGALAVQRPGAQSSYPDAAEIAEARRARP
ncbi:ribokinase [Cellulomonas avistercoris]|uniref:ribokinase n=1 Tax=Cellulomonas avistercoris TaxID=2762242 RepID=UPI00296ADE36|nr:ribokinase [Cellulomonas avistercoris]